MAIKIEKVTVSIPKADLKALSHYGTKFQLPRSALFRQAIQLWLKRMEKEEMRQRYAKVYSHGRVKEKQLREAAGLKNKEERPTYRANFPELCDIVLNDDHIKFLCFDKEVYDSVKIDGVEIQPPPRQGLPPYLQIPRFENVLDYAQNHGVSGSSGVSGVCKGCTLLFYDLVKYHQEVSELPNEDLYYLLSLWDFHTYLI